MPQTDQSEIGEAVEQEEIGLEAVELESRALVYQPAAGMNVERLMALAIEKDGAIEVIERLVALRNDEMDRQAAQSFYAALGEFQRMVPAIPRTKRGPSFVDKSGVEHVVMYAPLEGIQRIVNPLLHSLGLFYSWSNEATEKAITTTCTLRHVHGHAEASSMALPITGPPKSSATQASAGTRSFGKRLTLSDVLGISTSDDVDGAEKDKGSGNTISDEQLANLQAVFDEVASKVNFKKFCEFYGVEKLSELPVEKYTHALEALERRR